MGREALWHPKLADLIFIIFPYFLLWLVQGAELRKAFPPKPTIAEWRLIMHEEIKAPDLQEQMNRVKRTLNHNPLIVYVTSVVGGLSLAFFGHFGGLSWLWVGVTIFSACTGFSMFSASNAKKEYKKLLEQLNG